MPNMLTKEDLKAIGRIVEEKIDVKVPPIVERIFDEKIESKVRPMVEKIVETVVDERLNDPEGVINIKFDAMQEQLDSIENKMLTRTDLERWEFGLTERYDKRYVRR